MMLAPPADGQIAFKIVTGGVLDAMIIFAKYEHNEHAHRNSIMDAGAFIITAFQRREFATYDRLIVNTSMPNFLQMPL